MNEVQDRIFLLVKTKNFTSAEFAEAIGVQPSNISHIMSGRNKPSLDLVMKILKKFPEIRSEWLLNGQGTMTKDYGLFNATDNKEIEKKLPKITQQELEFEKAVEVPEFIIPETAVPEERNFGEKQKIDEIISEKKAQKPIENLDKRIEEKIIPEERPKLKFNNEEGVSDPHKNHLKKIEKIVVFYEDRTFREYAPEN